MQQQIQSEHFQRIQPSRGLPGATQPFTAVLARNPAMPSPSRLQAFANHIPEAIQVQMPQGHRPAYMGQRQETLEPSCVSGASPCNVPSCPVHGTVWSQRGARPSPRNQAQFVQDQMQTRVYPSFGATTIEQDPAFPQGPMFNMHASQFNPRSPAQLAQDWQIPTRPSSELASQMGQNIDQTGTNVKTPTAKQTKGQSSGNTTVGIHGSG